MIKLYLILVGFLVPFLPLQTVNAETISKTQGLYVTTEDIILDIVFPTIDKKVQKEYSDNNTMWKYRGIKGITYNNNHSYDLETKIEIDPGPIKRRDISIEDMVKLRISPSCDSNKSNNQTVCNHGFKIEILEYKHLSQQE